MKIGIDLDNVLNNLNDVWTKSYNKTYSDKLRLDGMLCWNIHKYTKGRRECIYTVLNSELFALLTPTHCISRS